MREIERLRERLREREIERLKERVRERERLKQKGEMSEAVTTRGR